MGSTSTATSTSTTSVNVEAQVNRFEQGAHARIQTNFATDAAKVAAENQRAASGGARD